MAWYWAKLNHQNSYTALDINIITLQVLFWEMLEPL